MTMSKAQLSLIASIIKDLPSQHRQLVAWRFARYFHTTNVGFNMVKFLEACGVEPVKESER